MRIFALVSEVFTLAVAAAAVFTMWRYKNAPEVPNTWNKPYDGSID